MDTWAKESATGGVTNPVTTIAAIPNGWQYTNEMGNVVTVTYNFNNTVPSNPVMEVIHDDGAVQSVVAVIPLNSYDVNIQTTGGFALDPLLDNITITETDGETHVIDLSYLKQNVISSDSSINITTTTDANGRETFDLSVVPVPDVLTSYTDTTAAPQHQIGVYQDELGNSTVVNESETNLVSVETTGVLLGTYTNESGVSQELYKKTVCDELSALPVGVYDENAQFIQLGSSAPAGYAGFEFDYPADFGTTDASDTYMHIIYDGINGIAYYTPPATTNPTTPVPFSDVVTIQTLIDQVLVAGGFNNNDIIWQLVSPTQVVVWYNTSAGALTTLYTNMFWAGTNTPDNYTNKTIPTVPTAVTGSGCSLVTLPSAPVETVSYSLDPAVFPTSPLSGDEHITTTTGVAPTNPSQIVAQYIYDGVQWAQRPSGSTCPAPMTRATLINLRNTNSLNINCAYVITDHVQGRLVAGTTITLQAVSSNELSENVSVNTTYDNEAWRGIYDLDRAIVLELQDNRGNIARGFNGVEVSNFDWGNTAYTNVIVDNATLTVTYGAAALITNVTVDKVATLTLTNFTGTITNSNFSIASTANFTGANGTWRYMEMKDSGSFNASSYTGGNDNYYNDISSSAVINFSNTSSLITFRNNTVMGTVINNSGHSSGSFTLNNSILGTGNITRSVGAGSFNSSKLTLDKDASIAHATGVLNLTRVNMEQAGSININTNVATTSISDTNIRGSSQVSNSSLTTLTVNRTTLDSISNIIMANGSAGTATITDARLFRSGSIQKLASSTAGTLTINSGAEIDSSSFIYHNGTGNLSVSSANLYGSSRIYVTSGNRDYNITRLTGRNVAHATLNATGAGVTDIITDVDIDSRGGLNMSATGAATNTIQYSSIKGLSGTINVTGTSTGQILQRAKAFDGGITANNCSTAMTHDMLFAINNGSISIQNLAVAKALSYATANAGNISLTGTVAGSVTRIDASVNGNITISGAAGSVTAVDVSEGTVAINGGASHANITKRMNSTLTTGNFTTNNIIHMTNVNKTLTANNTARADYLGLVSSVPLV